MEPLNNCQRNKPHNKNNQSQKWELSSHSTNETPDQKRQGNDDGNAEDGEQYHERGEWKAVLLGRADHVFTPVPIMLQLTIQT